MCTESLLIASTGGAASPKASFGWVLSTNQGQRLLHFSGPAYGPIPILIGQKVTGFCLSCGSCAVCKVLSLEQWANPGCVATTKASWHPVTKCRQNGLVAFSFKEFLFSLFSLPFGPYFPCSCSCRKMRKHDSEHFPCFPAPAEAWFRSVSARRPQCSKLAKD